jgi:hypothetical protein
MEAASLPDTLALNDFIAALHQLSPTGSRQLAGGDLRAVPGRDGDRDAECIGFSRTLPAA